VSTPPRRIYSFPHWTDNPFVNLLYLDAQTQGWQVVGSRLLQHFVRVVSESSESDVIHVHWTSPIVQRGQDPDDAALRRMVFEEAVTAALARGTRVVWSIHNVLPHDASFVDEETALCRFLSEVATRIHILSSRTREIVGGLYPLDPDKLVRVPHSSYWGIYDQTLTRGEARDAFDLSASDVVVGFVGQLRPYKGADTLIRAVELLQQTHPSIVLMLAGKTRSEDVETFDRLVERLPRVIRFHGFVADHQLPMWMRAIDIMALPYRAVLNSGSIALAATYGVPVVTPVQAGFAADFSDESWVTTYDATSDDDAASLADGLERRIEAGASPDPRAVSWAHTNTPFEMSKAFTDRVLRGN
jgi:glycosyltransferase involved in cell wall biosynthesis